MIFKIQLTIFAFIFVSFNLFAQNDNREKSYLSYAQKGISTANNVLNTDNYDVKHYTLEINANPNTTSFSGSTTIKFRAITALNQITFDADDALTISGVEYLGNAITNYTHVNNQVTIVLPNSIAIDEVKELKVSYNGVATSSSGFMPGWNLATHNGTPIIYTLSESYHAKKWFICKESLGDKSDEGVDIVITHPNVYKAASNGLLLSENISGNNTTTHWKHSYPIVPYLIFISVTNYVTYNNSITQGSQVIPIINYIYPENNTPEIQAELDAVPGYMTFLREKFGDYPYKNEKYGHAQCELPGGMEHATMSSVINFSEDLVIHELAHQYFGDMVTCGTWQDVWLNEGFSTYCEGLYKEQNGTPQDWINWKFLKVDAVLFSFTFPHPSLYISSPTEALNEERLFNYNSSYCKGAMVLHMLRKKMGDTAFFQAINNYLNDPNINHGFALTTQLKTHLEAVFGSSLTEFFNDWVYGRGFPYFTVNMSLATSSSGTLTASQTPSYMPSGIFYETSFEVAFKGSNGQSHYETFQMSTNNQTFTIPDVGFPITSIEFNPNWDIIAYPYNITLEKETFEKELNFKLYPNPVNDNITIKMENRSGDEEVVIYSIDGKLIYRTDISENETKINTDNIEEGFYLLKIFSDGKSSEKKFIKSNN